MVTHLGCLGISIFNTNNLRDILAYAKALERLIPFSLIMALG
jgi:predicted amino acid racemase